VTIIVADEYGSEVALPTSGGMSTGGFTINNAVIPLSPYNLTVYITNQVVSWNGGTSKQDQSFYVIPSYGDAQLIASYFTAGVLDINSNKLTYSSPTQTGDFSGTSDKPNAAVGRYTYQWMIPQFEKLSAKIVYSNVGNPTVTDYVTVTVVNTVAKS